MANQLSDPQKSNTAFIVAVATGITSGIIVTALIASASIFQKEVVDAFGENGATFIGYLVPVVSAVIITGWSVFSITWHVLSKKIKRLQNDKEILSNRLSKYDGTSSEHTRVDIIDALGNMDD
jgi:uncharacterized membrane protein YgaE (UPF0421/DUF939 family)